MIGKVIKICVAGAFIAVAAHAVLQSEKDLERIAEENGFDAERTAAFKSCDGDMSGKSLTVGGSTYSRVPKEICACHSQEMVAVFKSGSYSSHDNVVDYLTDETIRQPLTQSHLKNPSSVEGEFARLEDSLTRCVMDFAAEEDRRAREALQNARDGHSG